MLFIASDHGGFKLKKHLVKYLTKQKIPFKDLGPSRLDPKDDYPDYAIKVSKKVSGNPMVHKGVLICRSGQGMAIVANKFKGVRSALVWNASEAKISREHDMTNVLSLPSDFISPHSAENILDIWMDTPYSDDARHIRRVKKITALEK